MKKKKEISSVSIHSFSKKTDLFFSSLLGLFALSCTLPFVFVIIISMTDEKSLA
ncbi:TPA: carbohydrate ABC transporter permease, partial [Streptococcus suis]